MKLISKLIALGAMAALAGTTLSAQQQEQQTTQPNANSDQSSSQSEQNSAWQKAQTQEFFRASKQVGKTVQDSKGQKLGSLKDIAFNQQGEIFALVETSNDRWAAVPWQVVNAGSAKGSQNVVLNATQQELKSAPAVTKDQWGALNNPNFTQGIYSYYHIQAPAAAEGAASSPSGMSQGQGSSNPQQQQNQQQQQQQPQQQK